MLCRKRLDIRGTVQGVGFRPFVFRLANELGLTGHVLNVSGGLIIEAEGPETALAALLARLTSEAPPPAQIESIRIENIDLHGGESFTIHHSIDDPLQFAMVPPDIATCEECWNDFTDHTNRRYLYPFTNCTNCGPRYTIIEDIPYDRPKTTMSSFRMCPECQAEYDDPSNRRFHAQPNACPVCGPSLSEDLKTIRQILKNGAIVAIKGLGGFHLACDAQNEATVRQLRENKRRSDKPFALMVRDLEDIEAIAFLTDADKRSLTSPRRPIVLLRRRPDTRISQCVAPGTNNIGIMLPYTPLHYLLFGESRDRPPEFPALVMTSGNMSEEPIVSRNEDAPLLAPIATHFLFHNRDIQTRVDDSVVRTFEGKERLIRRSRGYAPQPIELGHPVREVLACGGELKNTFCLTKASYAILSSTSGTSKTWKRSNFLRKRSII